MEFKGVGGRLESSLKHLMAECLYTMLCGSALSCVYVFRISVKG